MILALHSESFGHKRIAKKLGLSRQSVYRILKRAGRFDRPMHLN
ncbi:MAG: helix-turn-helix domain-containing protein [Rhizobiales bacterium]|nr:helix-turn-helix domain-containing protein [Hyphomicrobiales bacterium]